MINKIFLCFISLAIMAGMIIFPSQCITAAYKSLLLCANNIIPSLFPFFVCVKLLNKTSFSKNVGSLLNPIMRPVFNVPGEGAYAFLMGLISGYPIGAKCAVEMVKNNSCIKSEAERLVAFCNNSSPVFVIGAIGVSLLGSKTAGIILYASHILSAITVGIILGAKKSCEKIPRKAMLTLNNNDSSPIADGVSLILYVCGYIVFFSIITTLLDLLGIFKILFVPFSHFGMDYNIFKGIFTGLVEMTSGIKTLSSLNLGALKLPLISFILGFSGICILLQITGVTDDVKLNKSKLVMCKLMQGVISFVYTSFLIKLPVSVKTSAFNSFSFVGNVTVTVLWTLISILFIYTTATIFKIIKYFVYKRKCL